MSRFCFTRDIYHKAVWKSLKTWKGKKAILVVRGGLAKRQDSLDRAVNYLWQPGMGTAL